MNPKLQAGGAAGLFVLPAVGRATAATIMVDVAPGLQPASDLESAILETLAPGAYAAIVAGKGWPSRRGAGGSLSDDLVQREMW